MTFTDDDLERLKEFLAGNYDFKTAWDQNECMDLTNALLARLEAAEAVAGEGFIGHTRSCLYESSDRDEGDICTCGRKERRLRHEAWRKAAGK